MSTSFRLLLPAQLYTEMLAQARAELPNECCGLLAGRIDTAAGVAHVVKRYPFVNAMASPREFESDPSSRIAADKDRRQNDLEELAIYHSHPTSPSVPSRRDLEMNYSPDVMNFIISLQTPEPLVRAWWLTAEGYREAEWMIVY